MAVLRFEGLVDTGKNISDLNSASGYGGYQPFVYFDRYGIYMQYKTQYGGAWNNSTDFNYAVSSELYIPSNYFIAITDQGSNLSRDGPSGQTTVVSNRVYIKFFVDIINSSYVTSLLSLNTSGTYREVRMVYNSLQWKLYRV